MRTMIWISICVCISQSAMFSGLNLAFFSISRLRLEIEAAENNARATRVLQMRKDGNFLLTTILWGNVAVNVLLALLSDSVMAGVMAFLFSTVLITFAGEIIPQAYFSRNSLKMASLLAPVLRFYQVLLYPVAKPTAFLLDKWLGPEAVVYFKEKDLRELLQMHIDSPVTEIGSVEGKGAMNFLNLDDISVGHEGELVDPASVIRLEFVGERPTFPPTQAMAQDSFLRTLHHAKKKWVIVVDQDDRPRLALDADGFLRDALFAPEHFHPLTHCHQPIIVEDEATRLGSVVPHLKVCPEHGEDDVVDRDIILVWGRERRIITGSDILGRLLRGIARTQDVCFTKLQAESQQGQVQ